MQQSPASSSRDMIPRLLQELRDAWVRKTGKPIDPDIDFLTVQIEMLSAVGPTDAPWLDLSLKITPKEGRIVAALSTKPGRIFSREALMNAVYFDRLDDAPDAKIIDVFIARIRQALIQTDANCWIETVWSVGWRWVAKSARAEYVPPKCAKGQSRRKPRRVNWRGIVMGRKEAILTEHLFTHIGQWVRTVELQEPCGLHSTHGVGSAIHFIRTRLIGSPYRIENEYGKGYRMVIQCE